MSPNFLNSDLNGGYSVYRQTGEEGFPLINSISAVGANLGSKRKREVAGERG